MAKEMQTQFKIGPAHDQIAALAYEFWEKNGRQPGHAEEHWLKAEMALRASARLPDSRAALMTTVKQPIAEPATTRGSHLHRESSGPARRQFAPR